VGKTTPSNVAHFLDVIATPQGEQIKLTAFKDKSPSAKTKLLITNPDGWEKVAYTNANGEAIFKPNRAGMYLVEMEYLDKTPGHFKGKDYKMIRNKYAVMLSL
jgi:hypothetical protein